jgi:hypothetical protein
VKFFIYRRCKFLKPEHGWWIKKNILEQWWNATNKGTLKFWKRTLSYIHFVFHKFQTEWLECSFSHFVDYCNLSVYRDFPNVSDKNTERNYIVFQINHISRLSEPFTVSLFS